MKTLILIKEEIFKDTNLLTAYTMLICILIIIITVSIVTIRIEKLKIVLRFVILFFKKDINKDDIQNI